MAQSGDTLPPAVAVPPTPLWWRAAIATVVVALGGSAYALRHTIGLQAVSAVGVACLLGTAACFSKNLRAVNWRTIAFGFGLQLLLAVLILRFEIYGLSELGIEDGTRPVYLVFKSLGDAATTFIDFSNQGARFVFNRLSDPVTMRDVFRVPQVTDAVIVAFTVLPVIVFVSSVFSILYYFGVLQFVVRLMARLMMYLMRTSGAETLSAAANVFMGQTEAPLIVRPYISRMTQSELLAIMVGGMATIAGSVMAVYISFGADAVALLATSVMAAPCGLYLSKLILPETGTPETAGVITVADEQPHANAIDAAAAGASDGMRLAINVAAMLIAFLALLALVDYLLARLATGRPLWQTLLETPAGWHPLWWQMFNALLIVAGFLVLCLIANRFLRHAGGRSVLAMFGPGSWTASAAVLAVAFIIYLVGLNGLLGALKPNLQLKDVFGAVFAPLAFLMGVADHDHAAIADLLGTKIAANEFVAFLQLRNLYADPVAAGQPPQVDHRSYMLATYALTGFANFGSIGIQIGGIGALAPERRGDLARLGLTAMLVGFLATVINAAMAGMLMDFSGP